jgi:transposase
MRVSTVLCRLLRLDGVRVTSVAFAEDRVLVGVALRRRRLVCPRCAFSTWARESIQDHESVWRHLDLGVWCLEIRATLRQLRCQMHGVRVEGVPFARHRAGFTRDMEEVVPFAVELGGGGPVISERLRA